MRRDRVRLLATLAPILAVTMAAAAVLVTGIASRVSDEPERISDAEHDRLLATCLAATDDSLIPQTRCPKAVAGLVDAMDERACGYAMAARALDAILAGGESELRAVVAEIDRC